VTGSSDGMVRMGLCHRKTNRGCHKARRRNHQCCA
jgi:hypothetical protein